MHIAIVAGETSGDILGSRLITALKSHYPNAVFEGIAGKEMKQAGCTSLFSMERLSIMGFVEVLPRLFELLKIRKSLIQRWTETPPDLVIGIDAPAFNLKLEKILYVKGITTVHYVSPSVWAWKEGRVKKMKGTMDLMLTLFPFEVDFYKNHNIPAKFVGHPLADEIPLEVDRGAARRVLKLDQDAYVMAVLPGSRAGEIKHLASDFLQAIEILHKNHPDWVFVVPMVNADLQKAFLKIKEELAITTPITIVDGESRTVMAASNQVLMASGTAVLEGMLLARPMVAAYRVAPMTAHIIRLFKMIKSKYFTLPNNLADEELVPEIIQEDITPQNLVKAIEEQFQQSNEKRDYTLQRFKDIHLELRQNASERTAKVLYDLIESNKKVSTNHD